MYCSRCGAQAPDNAAFCASCGSPLGNVGPQHLQSPQHPQWAQPGGYPHWQQQGGAPQLSQGALPATQPTHSPQPKRPKPRAAEQQPTRDQVPDPTFTKFVDAPDPPLPFWVMKILIALASLGGAGWALFRANEIGTIALLTNGMFENVPGVPFLIFAFLLIVSGICAALSKFSRGAAGTSGVCYFLTAGMAFTAKDAYPDDPIMLLTIIAAAFAVILLISAAGGVRVNLDD